MTASQKKPKAIVAQPSQVGDFIAKAIETNAPVETMERLFALHEKVEANKAKSAYVEALALFQSECPVIKKNKKVMNKDGRTVRYEYASLDGIGVQIKKHLAANGLSYSWDVKKKDNNMEVVCTVTHKFGHSESSTIEIPISADGYMTEPQKYASAQTYAKRYTLINALGITTADDDSDASDVGDQKDALDPKAKIMFNLRRLGYDMHDREVIEEKVKELTKLQLEEKNYSEIVSRLEALVIEKEEYEQSTDN